MKPLSNETVGFIVTILTVAIAFTFLVTTATKTNQEKYTTCIENNMQYVEGSCIPKGDLNAISSVNESSCIPIKNNFEKK